MKISNRLTVKFNFFCCQKEIGSKTAKFHWQGFYILDTPLKKDQHVKVVEHLFGKDTEGKSSCNLSWPPKGSSAQNRVYCSKPDRSDREWVPGDRVPGTESFEWGVFEDVDGHDPQQGARNDLTEVFEFIENDPFVTFDDMLDHFRGTSAFGACVRYEKFFMQTKQRILQRAVLSKMKESHDELSLRPWQEHVSTLLSGTPHSRHIIVILDQLGGSGKSVLSARLMSTCGMYACGAGRREDLSYGFAGYFRENPACKGVALDIPKAACLSSDFRTGAFTFAEQVKSQILPVTKYESTVLVLPPMHVVIFTNTPIPEDAFADNRVHLITLEKVANCWNFITSTH